MYYSVLKQYRGVPGIYTRNIRKKGVLYVFDSTIVWMHDCAWDHSLVAALRKHRKKAHTTISNTKYHYIWCFFFERHACGTML